jgi:hypothetical protein
MEVTVKQNEDQSADFNVPGGCGLCGNELAVRVSPAGAWAVCQSCRWIFHPQMQPRGNGALEMTVPPAAEA